MESFAQIWWSSCFVLFSSLRDTSLHFNFSHYLISSRHNCPLNPPQTHSKLQQPASQPASCWIIATALSHRGRRVTPELYWAPLCPRSVGAPAASDTRWRPLPSGSAPGRRGPARSYRPATTRDTWRSEDRRRRWVRPLRTHTRTHARIQFTHFSAMLFPLRALWIAVWEVSVCVCIAGWSPVPRKLSTSLLCSNGRGWRLALPVEPCAVHMAAGRRSNRECSPSKEWQEKWVRVCIWVRQACKSPTASRTSFELKSWRRLCGNFLYWTWQSVYVQCVH